MKTIKTGALLVCMLIAFPSNTRAQQITQYEFFVDTDPGVGLGTIANVPSPGDSVNFTFTLPVNSLKTGLHNLFVRFKDSSGIFGLQQGSAFYVLNRVNASKINYLEYFFDRDPGLGNGTAYSAFTPADSVNLYFNVSIAGLTYGLHNLFVRYRQTDSTWGLYQGSTFYIVPDTIAKRIKALEYFFDYDPGIGNGTALPVTPETDSTNMIVNISTSILTRGHHQLYIRYEYNDSIWGLQQGGEFIICNPPRANIVALGDTAFCLGKSVELASNTADTLNYQWLFNGSPISAATDSVFVAIDSGSYSVLITDTAGCSSTSNSISITVKYPPTANITTNSTSFCAGDSLMLQASTGSGLSYLWLFNGGNIGGATAGSYFAASGGAYSVIESKSGCPDTSAPLSITAIQPVIDSITAAICPRGSYNFHGRILNISGVYGDTLVASATGCDSIVVLSLQVLSVLTSSFNQTICQGQTYVFGTHNLTGAGVYVDTFTARGGCDSIVTITLSVLPAVTYSYPASVCVGSFYNFNGRRLTSAGTFSDTVITAGGCDSIVSVSLTVNPKPNATITQIGTDTLETGSFSNYQWLLGNNFIAGDTLQIYLAQQSGSYRVVVTDNNGCKDTSAAVNLVISGIRELSVQNSIRIYPNPVNEQLIAESDLFYSGAISPIFYDATCRLINIPFVREANKVVLNTSALAPGIYWIRFNIAEQQLSGKFEKIH